MENKIMKISEIPYCGSIYIEGYRDNKTGEIKNYSGTTNPENNWEDSEYFRAKWVGERNSNNTSTNCYYSEIGGDLED